MKVVTARLDEHERQLSSMSLILYGSEAMHLVGLTERLAKIEAVLESVVAWQREVKTTLRVGTAMLGASALFSGLQAWPQVRALLIVLGGGG